MQNIEMEVKGTILTIKIDLSKGGAKSASGKSLIIASSQGNISIPEHEQIKIGINCYTPIK